MRSDGITLRLFGSYARSSSFLNVLVRNDCACELKSDLRIALYLALNDIDYTKTKVRHLQTNGICGRFYKTILQEFNQATFRRKICAPLVELQTDLDAWISHYNYERAHQGKMWCGRTSMATMMAGKEIYETKLTDLK